MSLPHNRRNKFRSSRIRVAYLWGSALFLVALPLAKAADSPVLAILSFETLSANENDSWIGAGFAETLTGKLASVESALRLVERRRIADVLSVETIPGEPGDAENNARVGNLLGAEYLILGSVQIAGTLEDPKTRIQVTSRVVHVLTGEIVGGKSLSLVGTMEGLFALQSELALDYCELLGVKPLSGERDLINKSGTVSYEAYRLFCLGNIRLDEGAYREAISLYDQALKSHEGYYAEAHHNQGTAYQRLAESKRKRPERELTEEEYEDQVNTLVAENSQVFFEQGRMYMFRKKYRKAVDSYEQYLRNADVPKTVLWSTELRRISTGHTVWAEDVVVQSTYGGLRALDSESGEVKWTSEIQANESVRSVYADRVFYCIDPDHSTLTAISIETGDILWRGDPAYVDGTVDHLEHHLDKLIVYTRQGGLFAFQEETGAEVWRVEGARPSTRFSFKDDALVIATEDRIRLLDIQTGASIEDSTPPVSVETLAWCDPVLVLHDGERQLLGWDLEKKEVLWRAELPRATTVELYPVESAVLVTPHWAYRGERVGITALDSKTGKVLWTRKDLEPIHGHQRNVAFGDGMFFFNQHYQVVAADLTTGDIFWTFRPGSFAWSGPDYGDGGVYFASYDGTEYCLNAAGKRQPQQDFKVNFEIGRALRLMGNLEEAERRFTDTVRNSQGMVSECYFERSLIARARERRRNEVHYLLSTLRRGNPTRSMRLAAPKGQQATADGEIATNRTTWDRAIQRLQETAGLLFFSPIKSRDHTGGVDVPQCTSSPRIHDGRLYVTTSDGIVSIDPADGGISLVCDYNRFEEWHFGMSPPLLAGGTLIVQDSFDRVIALSPDAKKMEWFLPGSCEGDEKWKWVPRHSYHQREIGFDGETLIIPHNRGTVWAVDPTTGSVRWGYAAGFDSYSSPVYHEGKVFFGCHDGRLHAIDSKSGGRIWVTELGSPLFATPFCDGGQVFVGCIDGSFVCLKAETGELVWTYSTGKWITSIPCVHKNLAFVGSHDNHVYAVDRENGNLVWSRLVGSSVDTALSVQEGLLVVGAQRNYFGLDPTDGRVRWSLPRQTDWQLVPLLHRGRLYIAERIPPCIHAYDLERLERAQDEFPLWTESLSQIQNLRENFDRLTTNDLQRVDIVKAIADLDEVDAARETIQEWMEEDPESSHAVYAMGSLELKGGNYETANEFLRRAVEMGYAEPGIHATLGKTAGRLERFEQSKAAYIEHSLQDQMRTSGAELNRAILNCAREYDAEGRLQDAIDAYREMMDRNMLFRPSYEGEMGDIEGVSAMDHLRRYLQIETDPGHRDSAMERLEDLYELRYDIDYLEQDVWRRAVSLTRPDDPWFQGWVASNRLADGSSETTLWEKVSKGLQSAVDRRCPKGVELICKRLEPLTISESPEVPPFAHRILDKWKDDPYWLCNNQE